MFKVKVRKMKKLANKLVLRIGILMLATASALIGYSQDTYNFKELLLDNEGLIFTVRPDQAWENTSDQDLPKVLEKVYDVTNVQLRVLYSERDGDFIFTKFQQQYNNIDVFGGDFIVKRDLNGNIILINGCLRKVKAQAGIPIPADTALSRALDNLGNVIFIWEDTSVVDFHVRTGTAKELLEPPTPELVYYMENDDLGGDFVLAYRMEVITMEPAEWEVFVDAQTGQVLGKMNSVHPINGTGRTLYVGNVNIDIERHPSNGFILEDSTKKIFTYNWRNSDTADFYFWDNNTSFNDSADRPGVETHWGMEKTYDYYKNKLGRTSFDNGGAKIINNVNYDTNMNNAFWSKRLKRMYYGFGDGNRFSPLVSLDVVAHEFTHGVVQHTAALVYRKESGALNEGFADVFGASAEQRSFTNGNWRIGEDCFTPNTAGDELRDMSNPNRRRDPDCYDGTHWVNQRGCVPTGGRGGNDWCGVHTNSGVLNFWYYLLTVGKAARNDVGNNYSVTGIGMNKSELIAYRALSRYMNSTSDYKGARIATLQAAEDLYGKNSNEYKQVCNAWYAVNVGEKCCPDSMEFEFKHTKPKCHDSKDGKIELTIKKATGPFTYEWYENDTLGPVISTAKDLTGVGKGTYWIWVRDTMAKCEKVEQTKLEAPTKVSVSISGGGIHFRACDRRPEVFIQATGAGGTPPYTYNWTPNGKKIIAQSGSVGASGWYTAIVTDKNGCNANRSTFAFFIPIRCSYDPNDIIGPPSYGDDKWVSINATLPYKVRFENDPKFATAPAQKVTIDHPLDTNTDMASFRLSDFGFRNWVFEVPDNSSFYSKRLDLRDSLGIYVDVTAGLNLAAKKAFWIFESIDPKTGLPPADANVGFLAVNDTNTHVGEGFVDYTIKPKKTAVTGDSIRAVASIVFDNNPALLTPKIHNLIDAVEPSSGIRSIPSLQDSVNIPITMFGADDPGGSGFGAWDLYVSENGGAYTLYSQGLTDSTTSFRGNFGSEYKFYTLGLDNVSNKEKQKTSADITVTIAPDQFLKDLDSNLSLCAFDTLTIKWNFLNIPSFDLQYTADSGSTYGTVATSLSPADSIYNWIIPNSISGKKSYWIRAIAGGTGTPIDTTRFFELKDAPDVDLGPDTSFCVGTSFSLVLNQGGATYSSYDWSTGDTTRTYTATSIGTYTLEATNSFGCKASDAMTISNYLLPVISSKNITNVTCNGGSDGAVSMVVVSGNAPYSFMWSSGDSTQNISSKTAGRYIVTITDSVGCSIMDTSSITEPAMLASTPSVKNVSCFNGSDAEIDLNTSGGTAPYTYLWSNGDTTEKITGLAKGTFSAITTDANNCVRYDTITITEPALLVASNSVTNVSCFGGADGKVDLTVTGGTTAYSYLWSTTDTTQDVSGLSKGTYTVTVTDANGCLAYDTAVITEPPILTASTSITNVKCNGGNDGAIDLTVGGGTPGYTYAWSNSATTQDISSLTAGTYIVTIKDANNCELKDTSTVTEPTALAISHSVTNVLCNGAATGAVDLTVTGGTPGYSFLWSSGDTTEDISSKVAGTYTVVVTDTNSCTINDTAVITEPTAITSSASLTHVKCNAGNDGEINLTVSGGTAGYSYLWSTTDTTQDLSGLTAGTYSVRITDANGCIHRDTFTITQPAALTLSKQVDNISCNGLTDGSIDLTIGGGTFPYTYLWSNTDTTQDLSGLSKGTYSVTVTDANGCIIRDTTAITEPAKLASSGVISNVKCNGGTDGGVVLTVTGGTTPYTYLWSNTDTTKNLSGVGQGSYNVVITDANNCVHRDTFTITEPTALGITNTSTNVKCNGGSDGTASVTVTGGTMPYSYAWSNGDTTASITGLSAATYTVVVTDTNGCIIRDTVVITEPTAISLTKTVKHISCFGQTDGEITLNVTGGTGPYRYLWSNTDTTAKITGLGRGAYSVIITDANGCMHYDTSTIIEPARLTASSVITHVSCFGGNDGGVDLTTTGGTAPYRYLWSTTDTTEDVSGLPLATVSVLITDANGCTFRDTFSITEPTAVTSSGVITHVNCFDDTTGAVDLTVNGGTTPYSYNWDSGDTTQDISGKKAGTYIVTITDDNSCELKDTFTITQPTLFTGSASALDASCFGFTDGTVVVTMSGGVTPYKYLWSDGDTNALNGNVGAGTYSVLATDANGCTFRDTVEVKEPPVLTLSKVLTQVACNGGITGAINLTIGGGTPGYTFLWNNLATTEDISGLSAGMYDVLVKDANGCELRDTSTITEPSAIMISKIAKNLACKDDMSGSIDLTITGGTPGYNILWSNLATTEDIVGLAAGTYSVVVTDANNCKAFDTTQITEPDSLTASHTHTNLLCFGDANGTIDLTVMGGTAPYKYQWNSGDTTEDLSGLSGGEYTVIVTDTNNCVWYDTVTVAEPPVMVLDLDSIPEIENQQNGKAWVTVTGGVGPYTYQWNDPNNSTTDTAFNLARGVYTVVVKDANGCEMTDSINVPTVVGVGTVIPAGEVMIYPNPNQGWVGIYNLNELGERIELVVTDSRGRVIVRENIRKTDHYDLQLPATMVDGTYLLSLFGEKATVRKQMILIR